MTATVYVNFRDRGFWAYDVVSGVLLKHLIDRASVQLVDHPEAWLAEAVAKWRVNVICSNYGLEFHNDWSADQIQVVRELLLSTCDVLSASGDVSAAEMSSWNALDGTGVFPRGLESISTTSVIQLGHAIIQLLDGTLPEPPAGNWWFFTPAEKPDLIAKCK
jgi:hypothetical protein